MKSIVYVLCFLVPLVIVLLVIDYRDFYSGDKIAQNEVTTPKDSINGIGENVFVSNAFAATETSLAVIKPGDKPEIVKPKNDETTPVSEIKPTTATKHAEIKNVTET